MKYRLSVVALAALLVAYGCKTAKLSTRPAAPITASVSEEGFLNCFAAGTSLNGQPVWCEASAVLFDGRKRTVCQR